MLVERGKFRTTEKYFLEWSVDDGIKSVQHIGEMETRFKKGD